MILILYENNGDDNDVNHINEYNSGDNDVPNIRV